MGIDIGRVSALLDQMRPHWEKVPRAMIPGADTSPGQGLRVVNLAHNQDAARTKLYLYDIIGGYDGVTARMMVDALASVEGDLELHINSPGGVIYEGAAIYNAIAAYQRDGRGSINAVIDGTAASAASFVAQACAEVAIEANASMMTHDGQGVAVGTAATMREAAELLDMLSDTIAEMYARRGQKTAEEWREVMVAGDTWYNASEAVTAGLADRVIPHLAAGQPRNLLGLFAPPAPTDPSPAVTAHAAGEPHEPNATPEPVDVDALRNALKGVFA